MGEINVGIGVEQLPRWFIQGSLGTITSDEKYIYVVVPGNNEKRDVIEKIAVGKFVYGDASIIYKELAQAIHGKKHFPVTTESVVNLMKVLDTVRKSHKKGSTIKL